MATIDVINMNGEKVSTIELSDAIFAIFLKIIDEISSGEKITSSPLYST